LRLLRLAGSLRRRRGGRGRNGLRNLIKQIADGDVDAQQDGSGDGGARGRAAAPAPGQRADAGGEARSESDEDARAAKRAQWLVGQGLASKAIAVLSRRKRVLPLTPDVEERLQKFFPDPNFDDTVAPAQRAARAPRITFQPDDPAVRARIRAMLYNQSAGGPSGLTALHLRCVLQDETAYAALLKLLERIANGEVGPVATTVLLAGRLIPLVDVPPIGEPEPAEPKLRPVACSEVFTRLTSSLVNARVKQAVVTMFGSLQQGCGAPGGAQAASSHDVLAAKSGCLVITHDVATAYPTVSRRSVVAECAEGKRPALQPAAAHVRWLLGSGQAMIGRDAHGEPFLICLQKTGLQQGCALSPLMFCLAVHPHLEAARAAGEEIVSVCGYIDNVSLAGPPALTVAASEALMESIRARPEGDLRLKWAAHHVLPPSAEMMEKHWNVEDRGVADEYLAKYETAAEGCHPTALGVPLGSDEHMKQQLLPMFAKNHGRCIRALLDRSNCLSTQTRLLLLRYLLNGAATHAFRVLPPSLTLGLAQHLDAIVKQFVEQHVLDVDHIPMHDDARAAALRQAQLRVSEGGLGFMPLEDLAPAAYVAGLAQAVQAGTDCVVDRSWVQASLDECWLSGPVRAAREEAPDLLPETGEWHAFTRHFSNRVRVSGSAPEGVDWQVPVLVGDKHVAHFTRKLQHKLSEPYKRHLVGHFIDEMGRAAAARLAAASGPGGSAFLTCLPTSKLTTIGDAQFKTALRLRLGVPFIDMTPLPSLCVCEADLSANAYHLLACHKLCSANGRQSLRAEWEANTWNERHALIKDALAVMLSAAGVSVVDEPGALNGGGDAAPMPDQLLTFVSHGVAAAWGVRRVCTDITVLECNTTSRAAKPINDSLNDVVAKKRKKHEAEAAKAGVQYVTLAASSLGKLHKDFQRFLQLDDVRLDDDHLFLVFGGRRAFKARLVDSVSCAIARGTAYVAIVAAERLAFSTSGRHLEDRPELHQQLANRHRPPKRRARPAQRGGASLAAEALSLRGVPEVSDGVYSAADDQ
jgi:hypothetical protein